MKRVIEELIEKRKAQRLKFDQTLAEIGDILESGGRLGKKQIRIREKLDELARHLDEWMTVQDREWDAYSNNHATEVFQGLRWQIEKLENEYAHVKGLLSNFIRLEGSLQRLIDDIEAKTPQEKGDRLRRLKSELSVFQYENFEQRFRGSREQVREQLRDYLPVFASSDDILDLGCGRGEFLELLKEAGKRAEGVDASPSMLRQAEERDVVCSEGDILAFLKAREDHSAGGVFSSQVIEHFTPDYLQAVVLECHRVLRPGSPVLLETINPQSLLALSRIFFLDATHQNPLHPEFMRFLLERYGFTGVEIVYRGYPDSEKLDEIGPEHPVATTFNTNVDKLNDLLYAPTVYAAKGFKSG
jgi:O-antigen chain-terminating methyltransferase